MKRILMCTGLAMAAGSLRANVALVAVGPALPAIAAESASRPSNTTGGAPTWVLMQRFISATLIDQDGPVVEVRGATFHRRSDCEVAAEQACAKAGGCDTADEEGMPVQYGLPGVWLCKAAEGAK
jgi:hypothetical protein